MQIISLDNCLDLFKRVITGIKKSKLTQFSWTEYLSLWLNMQPPFYSTCAANIELLMSNTIKWSSNTYCFLHLNLVYLDTTEFVFKSTVEQEFVSILNILALKTEVSSSDIGSLYRYVVIQLQINTPDEDCIWWWFCFIWKFIFALFKIEKNSWVYYIIFWNMAVFSSRFCKKSYFFITWACIW